MHRPSFQLVLLLVALFSLKNSLAGQQPLATDGIWHPVKAVLGGVEFPKEVTDSIVLKLSGNQYDVRVNGQPDRGTYSVDSTTDPYRMTITGTIGPNKGKIFLAIFEMTADDSMRVCYDLTGSAFPGEFRSESGTSDYLVEYRKELPKGTELTGEVVAVPDGDIIEVLTHEKKTFHIRLNGIDAPEKEQAFGVKSMEALSQLITQKSVRIVTHGEDRYGQTIGDVYLRSKNAATKDPETFVNVMLVAKGYAWHYVRFAPDNKDLADAEHKARTAKSGLWADENPMAPWDWRKSEADKSKK